LDAFGRQVDGYGGALAHRAFDIQGAAVQFDKLFGQGQAKARALVTADMTVLDLGKGPRHIVQAIGRYADAN
jgi:hypothetical protein